MEYVCLILQIIFILGIFLFKTNDRYLVKYNGYYRKYLIVETITQGMCFVANCVIIFIIKELMIYVLAVQVVLMSLILVFYSRKAKKRYFNELINLIKENNLLHVDAKEIKDFLLKKYEQLHFIDDIEKCLLKINN
ncbi:MAG: hypothetical protein J6Q55_00580 [Clostridia bacterium]|nr:hypothetical protein [Clostridia bacterium]